MGANVIVFGWNRSLPGREQLSGQHFQEFLQYLQSQQAKGEIASFEPVLLEPHGGSFNGFFLIRGEPAKLAQLLGSTEWSQHQVRALMHLDGATCVRGYGGPAVAERMAMWMQAIPR